MGAKRGFRTVGPMTITVAFPLPRRWAAAPARVRHPKDQKIAALGAVPALARCRTEELTRLGATADLFDLDEGATAACGMGVLNQWWMPIDGWLLLTGDGGPDRTVPAGRSIAAWRDVSMSQVNALRLRALRPARVLAMPRPRFVGLAAVAPQLSEILAATDINPPAPVPR